MMNTPPDPGLGSVIETSQTAATQDPQLFAVVACHGKSHNRAATTAKLLWKARQSITSLWSKHAHSSRTWGHNTQGLSVRKFTAR